MLSDNRLLRSSHVLKKKMSTDKKRKNFATKKKELAADMEASASSTAKRPCRQLSRLLWT